MGLNPTMHPCQRRLQLRGALADYGRRVRRNDAPISPHSKSAGTTDAANDHRRRFWSTGCISSEATASPRSAATAARSHGLGCGPAVTMPMPSAISRIPIARANNRALGDFDGVPVNTWPISDGAAKIVVPATIRATPSPDTIRSPELDA